MKILRCYSMTEREIIVFCNAYKRIFNIKSIEFELLDDEYLLTSSDESLTLVDILHYFVSKVANKIIIKDSIIYFLADK